MAQSTQRAVSDGSLVQLDLSINYLDRSEITVYFDAVLTTAWAWVGTTDKRITFSPAVPDGVEVLVKRTSDISKLRHEFSKGAAFTAEVLDEDLTQVLHIAQEASETNMSGQFFADIDMHNYRIRNIGTAVDDTDALTLGQYKADANGAFASSTAAAASAASAASSATAAASSEASAASSEASAAASATSAGNSATAAADSAAAAATSATNAANASRLTIGAVTTGASGASASATIEGAAGSQVLNLTIPQGPAGSGTGDVLGPGAAVTADALAQWSGTTGTDIKAVTLSGLVKLVSGVPYAAVAGTDYVVPSGSITGNAATATKLQTASTITIGNTGKSVDGSANVLWSLDEIGAARFGVLPNGVNLNTVIDPGFYRLGGSLVNSPGGVDHGQLIVARGGLDTILQIVTGYSDSEIYWRQGNPPDVGGIGSWGQWRRFWHAGNLGAAFQGANQSLYANGYQKLPGGLIIQWGSVVLGDVGGDSFGSVAFPIAFPSQIFQVNVALYSFNGAAFDASAAATSHSLTGFNFTIQEWTSLTQNINVSYIAIGN